MNAKNSRPTSKLLTLAGAALASIGIAALYFRHVLLILVGAAAAFRLLTTVISRLEGDRRGKLLRKDALAWLEELTMALKAGKSLANAVGELAEGIGEKHMGDYDASVRESWRQCLGLIRLRHPIGSVFRELAKGLGLPELLSLSGLIGSAVDTGANLPRMFIASAESLREQMAWAETMEAALASRRMEGALLAAAPAAYTAFLRLVTPDYMAPLYTGGGWFVALLVFALQLGGSAWFIHLLFHGGFGQAGLVLPGFQEEIALYLQAGLSLPEAWQRAAYSRMHQEAQVQGEADTNVGLLTAVARQLALGLPFARAITRLATDQRGDAEIKRLAVFMGQNYQLGGGSLATLLVIEAKESRQRYLLAQQTQDKKRETKVLFPMILLLLSALILTGAPALLSV